MLYGNTSPIRSEAIDEAEEAYFGDRCLLRLEYESDLQCMTYLTRATCAFSGESR